jgi:hypothetical protein
VRRRFGEGAEENPGASNTIDMAAVRNRAIDRKLRDVQELPVPDARKVLMFEAVEGDGEGVGEKE